MKVSFELSPRDVKYFRDRLRQVRSGDGDHDEETIIRLAGEMTDEARKSEPPEFVLERLFTIELLIEMLQDGEWRLVGRDRTRILDALAYFVDPDDLIPDHMPGIGYLDDAIMVELVAEELKHEIKAYEDFCEFRKTRPKGDESADALAARRQNLQSRMKRRRRKDRDQHRNRSRSSRSGLRLW